MTVGQSGNGSSLNADVQVNVASYQKGLNVQLVAVMESQKYATEFFNEVVPLAPYGQGMLEQTISGNSSWGNTFTVEVPRHIDGVIESWLKVVTPALTKNSTDFDDGAFEVYYANHFAAAVLSTGTYSMGGILVDSFDSYSVHGLSELRKPSRLETNESMMKSTDVATLVRWSKVARDVWVRMPTAHSESAAHMIPAGAIHYSKPEYRFTLSTQAKCICASPAVALTTKSTFVKAAGTSTNPLYVANTLSCTMWFMVIYLHDVERKDILASDIVFIFPFTSSLVSTVTVTTVAASATNTQTIDLSSIHPLAMLYFFYQADTHDPDTSGSDNDRFNFSGGGYANAPEDAFEWAQLTVNGSPISAEHGPLYWRDLQPGMFAERKPDGFLYMHSNSRRPFDPTQPSGGLNGAFVENQKLKVKWTGGTLGLGAGKLRAYGLAWSSATVSNNRFTLTYKAA